MRSKSSKTHSQNTLTCSYTTTRPRTQSGRKMPFRRLQCPKRWSRSFRARISINRVKKSRLTVWNPANFPTGRPNPSTSQPTMLIRVGSREWQKSWRREGWGTSQRNKLSVLASNARKERRIVVVGARCSVSQTSSHVTRRSRRPLENSEVEWYFCQNITAN